MAWVFFYGSYMNSGVLREAGLVPVAFEAARLDGFDIRIRPLANLVRDDGRCVWGLLTQATDEELERLYAHARDVLGGVYLPETVTVETAGRHSRSALCYIAPELSGEPPSDAYVDKIVEPARRYGFPDGYVARLESFRPARGNREGPADV